MATQNHLLHLLCRTDRERLLAVARPVGLELGQVICERAASIRHVYFPIDGFISLVAAVGGDAGLEVGKIGREGMFGVQLALGVITTPLHAVVRGAGSALQIASAAFHKELAHSPTLRRVIDRYIAVLMAQFSSSAGCVRFHQIGPRLACWLLTTHDRSRSDTFSVTHELLGHLLGVRRVGITAAAGVLQERGLITYRRGVLTVLDRAGLEQAACSCFASDRRAYLKELRSTRVRRRTGEDSSRGLFAPTTTQPQEDHEQHEDDARSQRHASQQHQR